MKRKREQFNIESYAKEQATLAYDSTYKKLTQEYNGMFDGLMCQLQKALDEEMDTVVIEVYDIHPWHCDKTINFSKMQEKSDRDI